MTDKIEDTQAALITAQAVANRCSHERDELRAENERLRAEVEKPIPMYLRCTRCSLPHIDRGEWTTRPHKTHLCEGCGHEWRISDRPTVGVEVLASQFGRDKE